MVFMVDELDCGLSRLSFWPAKKFLWLVQLIILLVRQHVLVRTLPLDRRTLTRMKHFRQRFPSAVCTRMPTNVTSRTKAPSQSDVRI
jgi:hypothetical protein